MTLNVHKCSWLCRVEVRDGGTAGVERNGKMNIGMS